jgi:multiple sugar transport system permease protein
MRMRRVQGWKFAITALAPVIAIYSVVRFWPIIDTLRLSFYQWNIVSPGKPLIGFDNFIELSSDDLFLEALRNTTVIAFGILTVTIPLGLIIAGLIHSRGNTRRAAFYEAAIFLPHVVSLVPAAMAWKWIFDARLGPLNAIIGLFGIAPRPWLFDPVLSVVCLIVLCSWQALGYAVLLFLVGLRNIPTSLYEAASLDGASPVHMFRYVSLPLLKPVTLYVSVVTLISAYNIYAQAFVLASDVLGAPCHLVRVLVLDML